MRKFASVDIGNTSVKITLFERERPVSRFTCSDVAEAMEYCLSHNAYEVAFSTTRRLDEEEKERVLREGWWELKAHASGLPVTIDYKNDQTLGSDRLAAAIGAAFLYPHRSLLIADAGTALTLDIISSEGIYKGGNISPGLRIRLKSLHEFTGSLPLVGERDVREQPFGDDTISAIACGVEWGMAYEIAFSMKRAREVFQCDSLLLAGGDAEFLKPYIEELLPDGIEIHPEPDLVAIGLKEAYIHNHEE